LIFPYVYLCRQYIELRLKEAVLAASRLVEVKTPKDCRHRIDLLWKALGPAMERIYPTDSKDQLNHVEKLITEFSERDKSGAEFRYPTDFTGKQYLKDLELLDV
jgi:hypothetical protein